MKTNYKTRSSSSNKHEGDQHRLVGQILDDRLRVISLNHISPRQWLYQVEPPSVGKTRRALKVLGDPLSREPGSFYRLKTAYDRLKRLDSPYIERAYECGLLHDLTPYIVVEWEPHSSLYEYLRLRRKPMTWLEAQSLLTNIARGLEAMHTQGIAHGDLRPQHILLRHPPSAPVIIDACINSAFGAPPVPGLDRSSAFWAPERWSLSSATASSDMYSLGALMFHCLHGHPPFDLDASGFNEQNKQGPLKSPLKCLEEAHIEQNPPECSSDIPDYISQLIKQLLSKSPRQRPTITETLKTLKADPQDQALRSTLDLDSSSFAQEAEQIQAILKQDDQEPASNKLDEKQKDLAEPQSVNHPVSSDLQTSLATEAKPYTISPILMAALCSVGALLGLILAKL